MTEKLGEITPGRYRTDGGIVSIMEVWEEGAAGRITVGNVTQYMGWSLTGQHFTAHSYDLIERIGDLKPDLTKCPECRSPLIYPRGEKAYCEECHWPDDVLPNNPHMPELDSPACQCGSGICEHCVLPKPFQMRAGRCRLRDGHEGVASKGEGTEFSWLITLTDGRRFSVRNNGTFNDDRGDSWDIVDMLDDEAEIPLVGKILNHIDDSELQRSDEPEVPHCQRCGMRSDGNTEKYELGCVCPLVIEAGGVYHDEGSSVWSVREGLLAVRELDGKTVEVNKNGHFLGYSYPPLIRPYTPAPTKKVYRMADESLLPGWAEGYFAYERSGVTEWYWYWGWLEGDGEIAPENWHKYATVDCCIPPEHAPQNLPDDFDWRDSLVMREGK